MPAGNKPKGRVVALALLAPVAASLLACSPAARRDSRGTKRMADTLAVLYARAAAQPDRYEFLNRERADAMQLSAFQQGRPTSPEDRYALARQLLLAGRTRDAISQLERLQRATGLPLDRDFPQTRQLYDLLGIAYLRLGEQENCNLNPNVSVCILGELHHTQQEGARQAIGVYEDILRAFPDDPGSRWLLNIAYMAVGGYPALVPKRYLIPGLGLTHDPSFPVFFNVAQNVGADVSGLAGGLCVEDFNRDGLLDRFTTAW